MTDPIGTLPYIPALGNGGPRALTQMVVIHATDNTASAHDEAEYATRRPDETSAHFYVDDRSAFRALPLGDIAFGCFSMGNSRSVQFELCGLSNQISDATMRNAAPLVAEVCRLYGLPIERLSPADLVAGRKGVCGHLDVTQAWHQGDHTDPGSSFPWSTFLSYVQAASGEPVSPGLPPSTIAPTWPGRYLKLGVTGDDVRRWQARMAVRGWHGPLGGRTAPILVDGDYGPQCDWICRQFQAEKGLQVDGIVGPVTWRATWEAPIT